MIEKVEAQISVTVDKNSLKQSEQEIERLKSPTSIKMSVDLGTLRRELEIVKQAIRQAEKSGDLTASLKFRGDAEVLKKQITQANRELTNFVRTGNKEVSVLGNLFKQVGVDINSGFGSVLSALTGSFASKASSAFDAVGLSSSKMGASLKQTAKEAQESGQTISNQFGGTIATAIGGALLAVGTSALFLGDKLNQAQISFEVMLGSAEKAKVLLEDLSIFASKTPFEIQGIRDSAKQLLAFGIESENLIGTLKIIGDISAGTGTELSRIAYAYGQVKTAGRLTGNELRQFTEAGVPLIAALAKEFGVADSAIKKMVEDGKVGFADVEKAFIKMTGPGGQFFDLMSRQSETLSGKISTLKDSVTIALEGIGKDGQSFAIGFVDMLSFVIKSLGQAARFFGFAFNLMGLAGQYAVNNLVLYFSVFISAFKAVALGAKNIAVFVADNMGILADNIGIAFDNVPALIAKGLKAGLQVLEDFINSAGNTVNGFAQKVGFTGKLVDTIKLTDTIVAKGGDTKFKSFQKDVGGDAFGDFKKELSTAASKNQDISAKISAEIAKTTLGFGIEGRTSVSTAFGKVTPAGAPPADKDKKGSASDALKKQEEILKKRAQLEVDEAKKSKATEKEKAEKILQIKKKLDEDIKKLRGKDVENEFASAKETLDLIKETEKKKKEVQKDAQEYTKKLLKDTLDKNKELLDKTKDRIKELQDALKEFTDNNQKALELSEDTAQKVADRYKKIKEEILSLKESQAEATNEVKKYALFLGETAFAESNDGAMFGDTKIKEIRAYLEEQKKLVALQTELKLARENTNESSLNSTKLSETESILKDAGKKKQELLDQKKEIEDKLGLKRTEAEDELKIALQRKEDLTIVLEEYTKAVESIEGRLTEVTDVQTKARISLYAQEEERLRKLIALRTEAGFNTGAVPTTSTTNNAPTVIVNATVNSSLDVNTVGKGIAKQIDLANKGINK